jgi:hypothetical protein
VASRLRPQLADIHAIFRHAVPTWARTPSTLAVLGQRVELPPSYAEFLTFCDGWTGLDGQTDLFPISALLDGPAAEAAWVVVEAYDDGSGGQFGLSRDRYLVIGAAEASLSVVLLDLASPPRVCWLTQGGVEEFPAQDALIATAIEYQVETLAALRADPWLGISDDAGVHCHRHGRSPRRRSARRLITHRSDPRRGYVCAADRRSPVPRLSAVGE